MKKGFRVLTVALIVLFLAASCASTVAEKSAAVKSDVGKAKSYVFSMYNEGREATATASDYTVVGVVTINGVTYKVDWSVDADGITLVPSEDGKTVTVDVDEKTASQIDYTLTATVSDGTESVSTSFAHYVPAFKESTWAEYVAAADDATVVVKGVVTGIISKSNDASYNCIYFEDTDGGYYAYSTAEDPLTLGVKTGDTIRVTGVKDLYSGTHEIKSGAVEILSTGAEVVPTDLTAAYEAASSLKDSALTAGQSMFVTIHDVTVGGEDTSNGYYYFEKNGLKSYVRISSSTCPLSKADQTVFKSEHAAHLGWTADVTGIISLYDGAFYLTPVTVDSFTYKSLPEKSDSEKIDFEIANISIASSYAEDTSFTVALQGASYDSVIITWTSGSDAVTVDGSTVTVTLQEEETEAALTAVITCGAETREVVYTLSLDAAAQDVYIASTLDEAVIGSTVKYGLYQANTGHQIYFSGAMSGEKYLAMTMKAEEAADVTIEEADGGFNLSFTSDGAKKYISVVGGKAAITDEAASVWTLNAETSVPVTTVDGTDYYLGCYKTYETMSASKTSYILDDTSKIGVSQFPGTLLKTEVASLRLEKAAQVSEEKSYMLAVSQKKAGKDFVFSGSISGKYLQTSTFNKGAIVRIENADGGFRMYFDDNGVKTYIEISGGRAVLATTPSIVWTLDEETSVPVTSIDGTDYYLGCYKTYETISASKTSYIFDDKSVIGVSQFPAYLVEYELEGVELERSADVDLSATYTVALTQKLAGKDLYYAGEMSGEKYLATTTSLSKSVNVYLEEAEGGFRMYSIADGAKTYIEVVEGKAALSTEPTCVWQMEADAKTPYTNVGGTDYYLGTYKTYETISASKTSYILGDSLSKIDVSQFPIMLIKRSSL